MSERTLLHSNDRLRGLLASSLLIFAAVLSGCSKSKTPERQGVVYGPNPEISIIPEPSSVMPRAGRFVFNAETKVVATDESAVRAAAALNRTLAERYGITLEVTADLVAENAITFSTATVGQDGLSADEGYFLKIEPGSIQINGSERGMFYGVQSLIQLFPVDFKGEAAIPAAEIVDAPRFRYRGMHLDVARHFMPAEFVKKFIRLISRYKYNYFHWHLTDDQGWRVEIKSYPQLTAVGSKRRETVVGKSYRPYVGDKTPVEGYYTQEEIRDIVKYASDRYVTIIPEVELPGHSSAALASYPELGCRKNYQYKVQTTWGAFPEVYCPTEQTFKFVEDVLGEVMALFPNSPYIHVGGDEVITDSWTNSPPVKEVKRAKGLSSNREVQSWFIKRVGDFVSSNGKRIIAWDDVLDSGAPPNATVMTWRSASNAIRAARAGHEVIMAPADFTYFDHPQGDPRIEPLSLGDPVTLDKVYDFEPVPAEFKQEEARYVIGAQGCLWTEFLKRPADVEYMMFPRALALAEVLWSKRENRNFPRFARRLYKEFANLDRENVNYRIPEPYGFGDQRFIEHAKVLVDLKAPIPNGKIYYTFNGTVPHEKSTLYTSPFVIVLRPNETVNMRAKVLTVDGRESPVFTARYSRGAR